MCFFLSSKEQEWICICTSNVCEVSVFYPLLQVLAVVKIIYGEDIGLSVEIGSQLWAREVLCPHT